MGKRGYTDCITLYDTMLLEARYFGTLVWSVGFMCCVLCIVERLNMFVCICVCMYVCMYVVAFAFAFVLEAWSLEDVFGCLGG